MPTIPGKYGLVAVREVCVGRQCVNYALTKGGLWVPAPWAWRIMGRPKGVLLMSERTRVGGVEVTIEEAIAVVSLEDAKRLGMEEAVLAVVEGGRASALAKALLKATGLDDEEEE